MDATPQRGRRSLLRPGTQPRMRAALGFIMTTVTLDCLAMSIVIPVLPRLVLGFEGGSTTMTAHMLGLFGTCWALMQFVFSPVQGALSDRFGRRPVILLSNFGLGLDYLLMALAPDIWVLLVGRIISGITAASFSTAGAYLADITPPEARAGRFGMLSVAFGIGFVAGPAFGGLLGAAGPRLPFWVAAGLSLVNGLFGLFVLPESLPRERRAPWSWRRANPVGAMRLLVSRPALARLAGVQFLDFLAHNALSSMLVLYAMTRYGWGERAVGMLMACFGVGGALVGGLLTARAVRLLGERRALATGLGCGIAGFVVMALAPDGGWFLLGVPCLSLMGIAAPALSALMSRHVGPSEQGRLAGANSSLMAVAGIVGPTLYTNIFALFLGLRGAWHLPGAPFLLAAALLGAAVALALRVTRRERGRERPVSE